MLYMLPRSAEGMETARSLTAHCDSSPRDQRGLVKAFSRCVFSECFIVAIERGLVEPTIAFNAAFMIPDAIIIEQLLSVPEWREKYRDMINRKVDCYDSEVDHACALGHCMVAEVLIRSGLCTKETLEGPPKKPSIIFAVKRGTNDLVEALTRAGVKIGVYMGALDGSMALSLAIEDRHATKARYIAQVNGRVAYLMEQPLERNSQLRKEIVAGWRIFLESTLLYAITLDESPMSVLRNNAHIILYIAMLSNRGIANMIGHDDDVCIF